MELSKNEYEDALVSSEVLPLLHLSKDNFDSSLGNKPHAILSLSPQDMEKSKSQNPATGFSLSKRDYEESVERVPNIGDLMLSIKDLVSNQNVLPAGMERLLEKLDVMLVHKTDDSRDSINKDILQSLKELKETIRQSTIAKAEWNFSVKRNSSGFIESMTATKDNQ